MFQRAIVRSRGIFPGNEHNPNAFSQVMLAPAHNFPQTAPNAIANNRASDPTRSNEACAAGARLLYRQNVQR
jgi:hypothetical protein